MEEESTPHILCGASKTANEYMAAFAVTYLNKGEGHAHGADRAEMIAQVIHQLLTAANGRYFF